MSVNSSSSSNDSLLHPILSSNNNNRHFHIECLIYPPTSSIFTSFFITYIFLLLPLCIFIIYRGVQQWMQKRSTSSAATMSHSDCFIYNMVTLEVIGVFGSVLCCCGIYSDQLIIVLVGFFLYLFTWLGEMLFHVLTCVERYLAVVHPITYLSLRRERGIRIRNISIGCVWLLCLADMSLMLMENVLNMVDFLLLISSLTIVSFCSLSVLCVLIRPGPGEQGGDRERVDQSKQKAFYTIMAILGVLVMRFTWGLVRAVENVSEGSFACVLISCEFWLNLPSALVLPLLFLHRAGKLVCLKKNIQRG